MALIQCRWRRVLICVCVPCLIMLLALIYVIITVAIIMNNHIKGSTGFISPVKKVKEFVPNKEALFIAPGAVKTKEYSPTPEVFWSKSYELAFWNQLQTAADFHFKPVLHPAAPWAEPGPLGASVLSQALSKLSRSVTHSLRTLPEALQSYVSSMSRRQYPVLLEPRGRCDDGATQERGPLLLLAIKSSLKNYRYRQAIRQSWGRAGWVWAQRGSQTGQGAYVHTVFLLGAVHPELQAISSELLLLESQNYGDILQWDVLDTPLNETVKQLLFWSWFTDTCGHTSFVFEGDDDVFVNTPGLVSLLQYQLHRSQNSSLQDFMMGHVVYGGQPNKRPDSQEYIPESFYRGWYPPYAHRSGRLSSALLLQRLLLVSHRVHLFPIEQVYVGMCLRQLNLSPKHHPAFFPSNWIKEQEEEPCEAHSVLLLHTDSPTHLLQLWDSLRTNTVPCSSVTVAPVTVKKTRVTKGEIKHNF